MRRLLAALTFFTRLPIGNAAKIPSESFSHIVEIWPLIGWLTGGLTAIVIYGASFIFAPFVAVILGLLARLLLTGALHEDGLADFCDGFGGGTSRESILAIMKDSRTGTYGAIGVSLYFLLVTATLSSISVPTLCFVVLAGDTWSKFCTAQIINVLPYARKKEEAKNGTIYAMISLWPWVIAFIGGIAPLLFLPERMLWACLAPMVTTALLIWMMKRKLNGYTGDCCGACFLISELTFFLAAAALWN